MNLKINEDKRGKFMEVFHFPHDGQVSYCTINPGETKGGHYHKRKQEVFYITEGDAVVVFQPPEGAEYCVGVSENETINIPINYIHWIKSLGKEVKFLIWCNEIFNPKDDDTFLPADLKKD